MSFLCVCCATGLAAFLTCLLAAFNGRLRHPAAARAAACADRAVIWVVFLVALVLVLAYQAVFGLLERQGRQVRTAAADRSPRGS